MKLFKLFNKKNKKNTKTDTHDKVQDLVNLAQYPTDDEYHRFLAMLMQSNIKFYDGAPDRNFYWDIKNGTLGIGAISDIQGPVLIWAKDVFDVLGGYGYSDTKLETMKGLVRRADIYRLQALSDVYDFPNTVDYNHLASQIVHGCFLPREIPKITLINLFEYLISSAKYDEFVDVSSHCDIELIKKLIPNIKSNNVDLVGYLIKRIVNDADYGISYTTLLWFNHFVAGYGQVIDPVASALIISSMDKIIRCDAWDSGNGYNLGQLNQLKNTLKDKTFTITTETLDLLLSSRSENNVSALFVKYQNDFLAHIENKTPFASISEALIK